MTRSAIPDEYLEGYAGILADVCATGRRLTRNELESLRARGERAAEAGLGLRSTSTPGSPVEQGAVARQPVTAPAREILHDEGRHHRRRLPAER